MTQPAVIDFGNGIRCLNKTRLGWAALARGHFGFDLPEVEVAYTENGVLDGGTIGATRAKVRHFRGTVLHRGYWTRDEIRLAFLPGVERTISVGTRAMPYYVEELTFPDGREGDYSFTLGLVSPLSHPVGPEEVLLLGSSSDLEYPIEYDEDNSDSLNDGIEFSAIESVTTASVTNTGDLAAPCAVELILGTSCSEFDVSINRRITRLSGEFTEGDEVVIDATTKQISVNGTSALSTFERATVWPELDRGVNLISLTVASTLVVRWQPRFVGLF